MIQIDLPKLNAQITKLQGLVDDNKLNDYQGQNIAPLLGQSAGRSATDVKGLNKNAGEAVSQMYQVMKTLLVYLQKAHEAFETTDKELAARMGIGV